jgi:hypothetical protein
MSYNVTFEEYSSIKMIKAESSIIGIEVFWCSLISHYLCTDRRNTTVVMELP